MKEHVCENHVVAGDVLDHVYNPSLKQECIHQLGTQMHNAFINQKKKKLLDVQCKQTDNGPLLCTDKILSKRISTSCELVKHIPSPKLNLCDVIGLGKEKRMK